MDPLNMHECVATAEEGKEETRAEVPVAVSRVGTETAYLVAVVLFDAPELARTISGEDLELMPGAGETPSDLGHVRLDAADIRLRAARDHRDRLGRHTSPWHVTIVDFNVCVA